MLHKELSKLMDLTYPYNEAHDKLKGTYLLINEKLYYIRQINDEGMVAKELIGDGYSDWKVLKNKVTSLKFFLPKTGVYKWKEENGREHIVYLIRRPIKQWRKSFHTNFYNWEVLSPYTLEISDILYPIVDKGLKPADFWSQDNFIYYLTSRVGRLVKGVPTDVSPTYEQEVKELNMKGLL